MPEHPEDKQPAETADETARPPVVTPITDAQLDEVIDGMQAREGAFFRLTKGQRKALVPQRRIRRG